MIDMPPERLFKIGIACFFIIACMNTINLYLQWTSLNVWARIGNISSIVFNICIAFSFIFMLRTLNPIEETQEVMQSDDIDEIIKSLHTR